ncbi:MAG: hypothetical protein ABI689_07170 [Thermoanaerobaculia bacterium]
MLPSPEPPGDPASAAGVRPGRVLPVVYAVFAHAALAVALGRALVAPADLATFPSSPQFVAYVHLLTLGFLASAVYGAIYAFAPSVLRLPIAERRADLLAAALHIAGTMALAHGLADADPWTAVVGGSAAFLGGLWVLGRLALGLPACRVPPGTRVLIGSATGFFLLGGGLGVFFVWARIFGLPGELERSAVIAAHAHLAAFGWLTGTLFGFGSRMLPMLFAARPGAGRDLFGIAALHGAAALGLGLSFLFWPSAVPCFALLAALAVAGFLAHGAAMARRRVRPAAFRRGFDPTKFHAGLALAGLALSAALGVAIAWHPEALALRRAIVPYGIVALLGFLAQMVFAVLGLLGPAYAWIRRQGQPQGPRALFAAAVPPAPLDFRASLPWLRGVLAGWGLGVPVLAAGAFAGQPGLVRSGAALLLLATLVSAAHLLRLGREAVVRAPEAGGSAAAKPSRRPAR